MSGVAPFNPITTTTTSAHHDFSSDKLLENGLQKARVMYDYDAKDATELSLMCDEVSLFFQQLCY